MAALRHGTGRDRVEWFAILDEWGAAGRPYGEIADWLTRTHGISDWWAQKLIVEYEQERGVRAPGSRRDGTFTVTASKSIAAPVERLYEAFVDAHVRGTWLPDATVRQRTSRPGRSARFDWGEGAERLNVTFGTKAASGKAQVAVEHARLPSERAAADAKVYWHDRLAALKTELEG